MDTTLRPLPLEATFDENDPQIKQDVVRMILQWCKDEGYETSFQTIQDEARVKLERFREYDENITRLCAVVKKGDWGELEKVCTRNEFHNYKLLLYKCYRQQYIELVAGQEYQKAFSLLNKRLKALEQYAEAPSEFKELCYLLTCKSVHDGLEGWEGPNNSRQVLADQLRRMLDERGSNSAAVAAETALDGRGAVRPGHVPEGRLMTLLQQAFAYQVTMARCEPASLGSGPAVTSLLEDFTSPAVPSTLRAVLNGHADGVKCITFVGRAGRFLASGGSDDTVRIWDVAGTGVLRATLTGHMGRIWDVQSSRSGRLVVSGAGDGSVRVWDVASITQSREALSYAERAPGLRAAAPPASCACVVHSAKNDAIYAVSIADADDVVVHGGHDRNLRVHDIGAGGKLQRVLGGHEGPITCATFNPTSKLIVSGAPLALAAVRSSHS